MALEGIKLYKETGIFGTEEIKILCVVINVLKSVKSAGAAFVME